MKGLRYLKAVTIEFDFFSGRSAGARCVHPASSPPARSLISHTAPRAGHAHTQTIPLVFDRYVADRLLAPKTRAMNPEVAVTLDVHNRRTPPAIKVEYTDGEKKDFDVTQMNGAQLIEAIEKTADKMMLEKLLAR